MQDQAFSTLEFNKLLTLVSLGAQTPMGRERTRLLVPFDQPVPLRAALNLVAETVQLEQRVGGRWSFSELPDPSDALSLLKIEGAGLEPLMMLELARLCEQALAARAMIINEREYCPGLWSLLSGLPSNALHNLVARVTTKILPSGELDDRASPELSRIRNEINRLRSQITRSLEALMRRSDESIQDELVTVRNDRFVIPVKSDHRGRIKGVAHGVSSSGATVFIEPIDTIDSNNELQTLRETELREVTRILFSIAEDMRRELAGIELAAFAVEELDVIGAKASFFRKFDCVIPEIDQGSVLELSNARHPLLEENLRELGRKVVPVSFALDSERPVMVISGANAGGKTVVLKTTGLLAIMALSGLPVPARMARIPFYASILADIGDQQSLAANLSTFTAHVANISRMIQMCRAPALVILDEVGTGTDPDEGSALGVAVVDHFRRSCGAHVIATTHYNGLKVYAANEDSVLNASVEFDEKTLQPTYRLLVGLAGSSSGIEIARRFGFPDVIVHRASELVGSAARESASYLKKIKLEAEAAEALRKALDEEREAVAEEYSRLDQEARKRERELEARFEKELLQTIEDFEKQSKVMLAKIEDRTERLRVERDAQRQSSELKRQAKAAAQATSVGSDVRRATSNPPAGSVRIIRDGKLFEKASEADQVAESSETVPSRPIQKGDNVRLKTFGSVGTVTSISGDTAEVRVGSVHVREKLANLQLLAKPAAPAVREHGNRFRPAKGTEYKLREPTNEEATEINLIGRTTDEAVDELDKFLDEAFMNGTKDLRIIHGHGTGALRRAVQQHLKNHPHVESFSQAPPDKGGAGATNIELKL